MDRSTKIINIPISKAKVLGEVAQKTGYTAAKIESEVDKFDNIATVDEDNAELMNFFGECRTEIATAFADLLRYEGGWNESGPAADEQSDQYCLQLNLHGGFNEALVPALKTMLENYFVYGILFRWFMYTNKEEAAAYESAASGYLGNIIDTVSQKVFTRSHSLY